MKNLILPVTVHKENTLYVAEYSEIGIVSQGYSVKEALDNLNEATELYLEECSASQFYRCIRPILSKIWDNPSDEIYDEL